MSEAKHTPGPWRLVPDHDHPDYVVHVVGPSQVIDGLDGIASPHRYNDRNFDEDRANMTLIAAAPELLEALKDVRYRLYGNGPGDPNIDAAIAKAEGRSP